MKALRTYCATMQLLSPHSSSLMRLHPDGSSSLSTSQDQQSEYYLLEELRRVESELVQMETKYNRVSSELYYVISQKDLAPGALTFYTTLNDPNLMSTLRSLTDELVKLKELSSLSEHMDFTALRLSLRKCVTATPVLERFTQRFSSLQKRWFKRRVELFYLRHHQSAAHSSSAYNYAMLNIDELNAMCPICCGQEKTAESERELVSEEIKRASLLQQVFAITRGKDDKTIREDTAAAVTNKNTRKRGGTKAGPHLRGSKSLPVLDGPASGAGDGRNTGPGPSPRVAMALQSFTLGE